MKYIFSCSYWWQQIQTGWIRWEELPQLHSTPKISLLWALVIRISNLGQLYFETMPQCMILNNIGQSSSAQIWTNGVFCMLKDIAAIWLLHHDNASNCTSLGVHDFLMKHNVAILLQPPYSPGQLIFVSKDQDSTQKTPFWQHSGYPSGCESSFKLLRPSREHTELGSLGGKNICKEYFE